MALALLVVIILWVTHKQLIEWYQGSPIYIVSTNLCVVPFATVSDTLAYKLFTGSYHSDIHTATQRLTMHFLQPDYQPYNRTNKGRGQLRKKTFSFGHCPNYLKQKNPPHWPQFGQLGHLFSEVEIQDLKVSLELRILYILYNILYICNLKNS